MVAGCLRQPVCSRYEAPSLFAFSFTLKANPHLTNRIACLSSRNLKGLPSAGLITTLRLGTSYTKNCNNIQCCVFKKLNSACQIHCLEQHKGFR